MRLLLSCGEPSGDLYAGALTTELRALVPDLSIAGMGGPRFAAAGGQILADYRGLAATGLVEAIPKLPAFLSIQRRLVGYVRDERPDAIVLIDAPDTNLRLATRVRHLRLGIPAIYYISPQIWAWRAGRLATIRRAVDRMLVIFPFEEPIYRDAGVPVEFVGHPLIDLATAAQPRDDFLRQWNLDPRRPTVALLPGSRPNEVVRILPDLVAACRLIAQRVPRLQLLVAQAPELDAHLYSSCGRIEGCTAVVVQGETDAVLAASDLALTASGTATVQAALHGTPMVVVYRLSPLTYRVGRPFVKVDTFAMVNLIAGRRVVPELIQEAFTPDAVAEEAVALLTDERRAHVMRRALGEVRAALGGPGASRRAAEAILRAVAARA